MISLHPVSGEPAVTHTHTHRAVTCPPLPPLRRFQTSQREHDKGQREGVVSLLPFFFFFNKGQNPSLSRPSETPTSLGRNYPLCFSSTTCEVGCRNLLLVFTLGGWGSLQAGGAKAPSVTPWESHAGIAPAAPESRPNTTAGCFVTGAFRTKTNI